MLDDPIYIQLLANKTNHNLDEDGKVISSHKVFNEGKHSLYPKILTVITEKKVQLNRGSHRYDRRYIEDEDSLRWAGIISWFRGTLKIIHSSQYFPSGREIMLYHRPEKRINYPTSMFNLIFDDMIKYGYLLPNWIPLSTRFMCLDDLNYSNSTVNSLLSYKPYRHGTISCS